MKRIRKSSIHPLKKNNIMSSKMVMGLMVASVSVLVGMASAASAMPGKWQDQGHHGRGNAHGQLARNMAHGYGGGNISVNIGDIIGNNNVIIIIINYFAGR